MASPTLLAYIWQLRGAKGATRSTLAAVATESKPSLLCNGSLEMLAARAHQTLKRAMMHNEGSHKVEDGQEWTLQSVLSNNRSAVSESATTNRSGKALGGGRWS